MLESVDATIDFLDVAWPGASLLVRLLVHTSHAFEDALAARLGARALELAATAVLTGPAFYPLTTVAVVRGAVGDAGAIGVSVSKNSVLVVLNRYSDAMGIPKYKVVALAAASAASFYWRCAGNVFGGIFSPPRFAYLGRSGGARAGAFLGALRLASHKDVFSERAYAL